MIIFFFSSKEANNSQKYAENPKVGSKKLANPIETSKKAYESLEAQKKKREENFFNFDINDENEDLDAYKVKWLK